MKNDFEHKVEVQNRTFGWIHCQNCFSNETNKVTSSIYISYNFYERVQKCVNIKITRIRLKSKMPRILSISFQRRSRRLKAEASDKKNSFNVDALWFKIFGLSLNVTFFLFVGATAEDSATTFRCHPLRLGGSGGTGGGWRGGLPRSGGATGASSSAMKAGLRR